MDLKSDYQAFNFIYRWNPPTPRQVIVVSEKTLSFYLSVVSPIALLATFTSLSMDTEIPSMNETITLTEKKVAMALDDIIKLSKRNTKGKKLRRKKKKNHNFNGATRNNTSRVLRNMNSRSAVRQGAVAKRRSTFQENQLPVTANIASKAATTPSLSVRGRAFKLGRMTSANQSRLIAPPVRNRSVDARITTKRHEVVDEKVGKEGGKRKTLDSRFASMKEQRKRNVNYGVGVQVQRLPPWARAARFS